MNEAIREDTPRRRLKELRAEIKLGITRDGVEPGPSIAQEGIEVTKTPAHGKGLSPTLPFSSVALLNVVGTRGGRVEMNPLEAGVCE